MIIRRAALKMTAIAAVSALALTAGSGFSAMAANKELKIGVLGVMSGPAASWGLVNRYCAETTANMINAAGGIDIGGETYDIKIVSIDDRNDPKVAVTGAERLVYEEKVKYIIGPNIDTTAAAIVPVVEKAGAVHFPYAFSKDLYTPPRGNSVLGMIASYQAGPVIYKHLMDNNGVKKVAFVARNESDSINQRTEGVEAAKKLGLEVVADSDTYEAGTTDFFPVMSRLVGLSPDLIVLSGVAPSDAPLMLKSARELGYTGLMSTETAQDATILAEVAGDAAEGFISVGGASTESIRTDEMNKFIDAYKEHVGEWNDEAGTKVYALEIILRTMQANPDSINDVEKFKAAMATFSMKNPYVKGDSTLQYVGSSFFGQKRQISVPMVVNVYKGGNFETMFVGAVDG
ncbi:ABC transporter substrate-binding protein [Pelagibius sp. Alg239-R121]|uniref:ABC transporter substrate-binding protein n=1 Tax=Pelagibius sp. Alg239-R121 TaxID=2993448 RepID=UPI0024A76C85|nr:ABC transporter substrate-binding protein [Pelagibius sp. Alg239-R121]